MAQQTQQIQEEKSVKMKTKNESENPMRKFFIEKILLSAGGIEKELEKSSKLLTLITGRKAQIISSSKRIPDFNVRPGLEVGTRITIRNKEEIITLLKRLLAAKDNILKEKQLSENHFSFGIPEYIEIPGMEYQRDIGIKGLNVTVVFARPGLRIKRKKIKSGHVAKKQSISKEEIIKFMEENFSTSFE